MINKRRKTRVSELSRYRETQADMGQFDNFWEIKCPDCGKKIDLEILINYFSTKKKEIKY